MDTSVAENSNLGGSNYHKLESPTQLQTLLGADLKRLSVLYFRAEWAEICKTADPFIKSLSQKWKEPLFLEIEAESLPDVAESFEVSSVPCFVILRGHQLLSRIIGAELPQLEADVEKFVKASQNKQNNGKHEVLSETTQKPQPPSSVLNVNKLQAGTGPNEDETEEQLFARCKSIMQQSKVVVFMKGDPRTPQCGFSQQTVKILQDLNIEFTTFDILTDEQVRQGMKKLNSWPTFPQIIIKGELVGGLDILKEMIQNNGKEKTELEELLEQ
ncbi:hypothetical protein Pst134EA_011181 [Puccinia striiformis f. sp. tritici]|uniref:hypothetical protein n=1 Tax=Puccinia striiformis f. sp. tritici TaxID=168172 RepID=UPI00200893C2|nr:hypothetical protein Pst134EA_011181 [Puccinia striiformis f. sp. tritici]KAH9467537.1 hypothetical protein Pst134EA_011181 [Puccinia striiformis f. sp. tritici]KAI9609693.1 hypothetical protein KEM48_002867 [Puccinia striiformis f. sp. tritici PST-130]